MNNYIIIIYYNYLDNDKMEKEIYNFDTMEEIKDLYMRYKAKKDIKISNYELYELKALDICLY